MSFDELVVLILSGTVSVFFLKNWYSSVMAAASHVYSSKAVTVIFILVPFIVLIMISVVLYNWASFDVVDDSLYLLFYMLIWFLWMRFTLMFMFVLFNISWADDALQLHNNAAVCAVIGGIFGSCAIYCGANIGDGPGWWCVFLAGCLGMASWYILAHAVNAVTGIFEKITVGRDFSCGIRFGAYLLASGIILGRASGGDWTSFYMTLIEFGAGWPVLLLTAAAAGTEVLFFSDRGTAVLKKNVIPSCLTGLIYVVSAVIAVSLLPDII